MSTLKCSITKVTDRMLRHWLQGVAIVWCVSLCAIPNSGLAFKPQSLSQSFGDNSQDNGIVDGMLLGIPEPLSVRASSVLTDIPGLSPSQSMYILSRLEAYDRDFARLRGNHFSSYAGVAIECHTLPLRRPMGDSINRYNDQRRQILAEVAQLDSAFFVELSDSVTSEQAYYVSWMTNRRGWDLCTSDAHLREWLTAGTELNLHNVLVRACPEALRMPEIRAVMKEYDDRAIRALSHLSDMFVRMQQQWFRAIRPTEFRSIDPDDPLHDPVMRQLTVLAWYDAAEDSIEAIRRLLDLNQTVALRIEGLLAPEEFLKFQQQRLIGARSRVGRIDEQMITAMQLALDSGDVSDEQQGRVKQLAEVVQRQMAGHYSMLVDAETRMVLLLRPGLKGRRSEEYFDAMQARDNVVRQIGVTSGECLRSLTGMIGAQRARALFAKAKQQFTPPEASAPSPVVFQPTSERVRSHLSGSALGMLPPPFDRLRLFQVVSHALGSQAQVGEVEKIYSAYSTEYGERWAQHKGDLERVSGQRILRRDGRRQIRHIHIDSAALVEEANILLRGLEDLRRLDSELVRECVGSVSRGHGERLRLLMECSLAARELASSSAGAMSTISSMEAFVDPWSYVSDVIENSDKANVLGEVVVSRAESMIVGMRLLMDQRVELWHRLRFVESERSHPYWRSPRKGGDPNLNEEQRVAEERREYNYRVDQMVHRERRAEDMADIEGQSRAAIARVQFMLLRELRASVDESHRDHLTQRYREQAFPQLTKRIDAAKQQLSELRGRLDENGVRGVDEANTALSIAQHSLDALFDRAVELCRENDELPLWNSHDSQFVSALRMAQIVQDVEGLEARAQGLVIALTSR